MQAGDVLLFRGARGNLIDRTIMWATRSRFVHVGLAVGPDTFIEACPPVVRLNTLDRIAGRDVLVVAPDYPSDQARAAAVARANAHYGRWYDAVGLLALAVYLRVPHGRRLALAALTRLPWHRGHVICSEVVGDALGAGALGGRLPGPPPVTTPAECGAAVGRVEPA